MIAVTLSAPDDWHDHSEMLDYGFSLYESVLLADAGEYTCTLECIGGETPLLAVSNQESVRTVLPKNHGPITNVVTALRPLCAPVSSGEKVGEIVFFCDGEEIGRTALLADTDLYALERKQTLFEKVRNFFTNDTTNDG